MACVTEAYVLFDRRADPDVIQAGHRRRPRTPSLRRYDPVYRRAAKLQLRRGERALATRVYLANSLWDIQPACCRSAES